VIPLIILAVSLCSIIFLIKHVWFVFDSLYVLCVVTFCDFEAFCFSTRHAFTVLVVFFYLKVLNDTVFSCIALRNIN